MKKHTNISRLLSELKKKKKKAVIGLVYCNLQKHRIVLQPNRIELNHRIK